MKLNKIINNIYILFILFTVNYAVINAPANTNLINILNIQSIWIVLLLILMFVLNFRILLLCVALIFSFFINSLDYFSHNNFKNSDIISLDEDISQVATRFSEDRFISNDLHSYLELGRKFNKKVIITNNKSTLDKYFFQIATNSSIHFMDYESSITKEKFTELLKNGALKYELQHKTLFIVGADSAKHILYDYNDNIIFIPIS